MLAPILGCMRLSQAELLCLCVSYFTTRLSSPLLLTADASRCQLTAAITSKLSYGPLPFLPSAFPASRVWGELKLTIPTSNGR